LNPLDRFFRGDDGARSLGCVSVPNVGLITTAVLLIESSRAGLSPTCDERHSEASQAVKAHSVNASQLVAGRSLPPRPDLTTIQTASLEEVVGLHW
jgi:hypothetical protein